MVNKIMLITGLPRSGTTWVGELAKRITGAAYLLEPFTPANGRPWFYQPQLENNWMPEPGDLASAKELRRALRQAVEGRVAFRLEILLDIGWRDRARYLRDVVFATASRRMEKGLIIKDPNLSLAVDQFCETAPMASVLFMIRNPFAFVSSCLVLRWTVDEALARRYPELKADPIDKLGLVRSWARFWRLIVTRGMVWAERFPQVEVVRHEVASLCPEDLVQRIAAHFDVQVNVAVERRLVPLIKGRPGHTRTSMKLNSLSAISRDSRQNLRAWRGRLENNDIEVIWDEVGDVARSVRYNADGEPE